MTRFRGVIEFVLFVASILKMRFTFCLIAQNIHQLETTFFNKIDNRIPNYRHIPNFTLIIQLMNSTDYYLNKQLIQNVSSCLEMRDNLLSKAWYCYLINFLLSLFYGHANKGHCCCCCCCCWFPPRFWGTFFFCCFPFFAMHLGWKSLKSGS